MLGYYTFSVDAEYLRDVVAELTETANSCVKKRSPFAKETPRPFRVIFQPEKLNADEAEDDVIRFYLVITPDFSVANEDQAWDFCQSMRAAAEAVEEANQQNYTLLTPPRRQGTGRH